MRAVRGTVVGALVREQLKEGREGIRKVSLRASSDEVDVSRIARQQGGGGHRQAAGFSTELPPDELVEFMRAGDRGSVLSPAPVPRRASCWSTSRRARPRTTSSRGCAAIRSRAGAKVGHAGTLDPFASGLLIVLVGQATRFQRYFMALPKRYRARARFGAVSDTGDPEGRDRRDRDAARTRRRHRAALPALVGELEQRVPARVGRQGRRRAPLQEGAPGRGVRGARSGGRGDGSHALELAASTPPGGPTSRSSARAAPTCASWWPTSASWSGAGAYCERARANRHRPVRSSRQADLEQLIPLAEALAFMPERRLSGGGGGAAANGRRLADERARRRESCA